MRFRTLAASLAVLATLAGGLALVTDRRAAARERAAEAAFPPTGQILAVEGVAVHVDVRGHGPDLVLIHGASGNTRDFTMGLADELARRFRVITLDRPGLGWTGNGGAPVLSPQDQARLLRAAVTRLGAERPLILGHSYGGAVALAWALDAPEAVAGLVVLSGATMPWEGSLGLWYRLNETAPGRAVLAGLVAAFAPARLAEQTVEEIFAPDPPPPGYLDGIGLGLTLRRASLKANAAQVNGLLPHVTEMARQYPALAMPVEILHGDADTITPIKTHARPLARLIPGARLTELAGAGHMPHHTHPAAVIAAIERAATRAGLH